MARKRSSVVPWLLVIAAVLWSQRHRLMIGRFRKSSHGWALVTGASSGIGAEFARELGRRGYNVVLVARRADRLNQLAQELGNRYGVQTEIIQADLTKEDDLRRVMDAVRNREYLDLLVNNAGFNDPGLFIDTSIERQMDMVRLHDMASVALTRVALPAMVVRGRGGIINTSSVAAFFSTYANAGYSASKAYLNNFSQTIASELEGTGVYVQAFCPGFVHTELEENFPEQVRTEMPSILWLNAEDVVRQSLDALGNGEVIFIPGWTYRIIALFGRSMVLNGLAKFGAKFYMEQRLRRALSSKTGNHQADQYQQ